MPDPTSPASPSKTRSGDPSPASWPVDALGRLERAGLGPLFEQLPATIWATDTALRLTFIQGRLFQRIGVPAGAVLGRTLADLLLDGREDHPLIQGHLSALAGCETSIRIEWGGEVYSARIAPLRDRHGEIVGCVGLNQVTAWVPDDEGTLRESDVRLRRVIDSSMIGVVFGNADGRMTDANDAFLHLAGYAREDLVADQVSWAALLPVERHQQQMHVLEQIRATGRCAPFETEILRKDGTRVPVIVGAARLSARRREGVAFVLDISDRKRTTRRLRAELACAELLIAATDRGEALRAWLTTACEALEWKGAVLWQAGAAGTLGAAAACGLGAREIAAIEPAARRALTAGTIDPLFAAPLGALIVPATIGPRAEGVIAFVQNQGPAPDDELIATMRSMATQVARFLRA
jgi:PAS domain S-box-containing protein